MRRTEKTILILLMAVAQAGGCRPPLPDPLADLPPLTGSEPDPARLPRAPAERPASVCLSHLLVSYRGAQGAIKSIRRDREGARRRAEHLLALARSRGGDFAALARRFSDDNSTSQSGGDLGVVVPGMLHPDLERAAFSLGLGQVAGPVETPRGFHLLLRTAPTEAQAAEIVISYDGARRYRPRRSRSREQAAQLAQELHRRIAAGEDFFELARSYSDLGNHERGGVHRVFKRGSRLPEFEKVVWGLAPGQVSEVIETGTGFHIVKRLPIERVAVRLIRIGFGVPDPLTGEAPWRTSEQARELVEHIHHRVTEGGEDFAGLASRHSEGRGSSKGGYVDFFARGEMEPRLEQVAFSLAPGQVSEVLEIGESFFLIKRVH